MANLCNCKQAKREGSGVTWYYVCKRTGNPTDPVLCRKCADREPQKKDSNGMVCLQKGGWRQ